MVKNGKRILIVSLCLIIGLIFINYIRERHYKGGTQQYPYLIGVNTHFTNPDEEEIDKLYESGCNVIRTDLPWSNIEKEKGVYDFSSYDRLVGTLLKKNIQIIFILDDNNKLYDQGMSPYSAKGRKAFNDFVKAAVKHYIGKKVIWEIWNEPNIFFWQPSPNVNDYSTLVKEVSETIKKVDNKAVIIAPALSQIDYEFLNSLGKLGVFNYIDAVSLHPYRRSNPETVIEDYDKVKELINKYPHKKDIQIVSSEWGYATAWEGIDNLKQAQYCVRQYLTNIMCNVKLSIWYDWVNDGYDENNKEHTFGVLNRNLSPKPTYYAIRTMNETIRGYKFTRRIDTNSKDDYLLEFNNGKKVCYVVWTIGESHRIKIRLNSKKITVVDLLGNKYEDEAFDKEHQVDISGSVQYIVNLD